MIPLRTGITRVEIDRGRDPPTVLRRCLSRLTSTALGIAANHCLVCSVCTLSTLPLPLLCSSLYSYPLIPVLVRAPSSRRSAGSDVFCATEQHLIACTPYRSGHNQHRHTCQDSGLPWAYPSPLPCSKVARQVRARCLANTNDC
ncbi:hypothetical protein BJX62DRAFT_214531 [Aspergillus germanicus]